MATSTFESGARATRQDPDAHVKKINNYLLQIGLRFQLNLEATSNRRASLTECYQFGVHFVLLGNEFQIHRNRFDFENWGNLHFFQKRLLAQAVKLAATEAIFFDQRNLWAVSSNLLFWIDLKGCKLCQIAENEAFISKQSQKV